MSARSSAAALLVGVAMMTACSSGSEDSSDSAAEASPTESVSPLPSLAGPRAETAFDVIRAYGVRPGSQDDFLIRDLLKVADAQRAYLAVHGKVASLDELKRVAGYRLNGSKLELVSGLGSAARFCLRSYQNDDSPRQWFYDTDHVLPRGDFC